MAAPFFTYPVEPKYRGKITDDFADHVARNSVNPGLDFATPVGARALNIYPGTVLSADSNPDGAGGRMVVVRYEDGWTAEYLHLSEVIVKKGQKIDRGEIIGLTGGSGFGEELHYGPHLHIATKHNGKNIDPKTVFNTDKALKDLRAKRAKEAAKHV